ncbi:MAG: hypothetical protein ACRDZ5_06605 [Acidimicrobiales bacterium]
MFVSDFQIVDRCYKDIEVQLVEGAERLLAGAMNEARTASENLSVRVGLEGWPILARTSEVRLGLLRRYEERLLVTFSWQAQCALLSHLDADIEAASFGPLQTSVALRGSYELPTDHSWPLFDAALVQRVAQSAIRAFLEAVCVRVGTASEVASVDERREPSGLECGSNKPRKPTPSRPL